MDFEIDNFEFTVLLRFQTGLHLRWRQTANQPDYEISLVNILIHAFINYK